MGQSHARYHSPSAGRTSKSWRDIIPNAPVAYRPHQPGKPDILAAKIPPRSATPAAANAKLGIPTAEHAFRVADQDVQKATADLGAFLMEHTDPMKERIDNVLVLMRGRFTRVREAQTARLAAWESWQREDAEEAGSAPDVWMPGYRPIELMRHVAVGQVIDRLYTRGADMPDGMLSVHHARGGRRGIVVSHSWFTSRGLRPV